MTIYCFEKITNVNNNLTEIMLKFLELKELGYTSEEIIDFLDLNEKEMILQVKELLINQ